MKSFAQSCFQIFSRFFGPPRSFSTLKLIVYLSLFAKIVNEFFKIPNSEYYSAIWPKRSHNAQVRINYLKCASKHNSPSGLNTVVRSTNNSVTE